MSAIVGIYNLNREPVSPEHISGMMKALQKFPANDVRIWQKENVFLGCHAQWITPESVGEPLPFYDNERHCAITADAIIDNRDELFDSLNVDREQRKTMPDSQLILLSYYKWGEDAPKHLVGDFAFMIWDEKKQQLFGARDFSGARTLYYYQDYRRLAFSTTLKPLLSLPYIENMLNENWLAEFLAIPGMNEAVDTSITVYKNIGQVPPSHSITITTEKVSISRYCMLTVGKKLKLKSNEEYIEAFREVFQNAVNVRLRTHRNVGAHLSGGLDSGSVVSFAARALKKENKQLHTFSYVPPRDFIDWTPRNVIADERPFIKSTVEFVGNINDHYYDFAEVNPLLEVTDWLETMEMPYKFFANSNWIKGIFNEAKEHGVGVLLNGGRGNLSISWGSALNYYAVLLKKMRWIRLYRELDHYSKNIKGNRLRTLSVLGKIAFPFVNRIFSTENNYEFPVFINPELAKRTGVFEKLKEHGIDIGNPLQNDIYDARKKHFEEVYPWNATGTLGTKLSLDYSLWKRDPTNDLRLIRFCLSLPEDQYVQNGFDRALIRRTTENFLPDKVRLNQRIRGIQGADCIHRMTPYWSMFIDELDQLSTDPVVTELINKKVIDSAISKVKQGPMHEYSFDPEYQILLHSLIVFRFIKKLT